MMGEEKQREGLCSKEYLYEHDGNSVIAEFVWFPIERFTEDKSSWMNSEVYRARMDNDPKAILKLLKTEIDCS